MTELTAADPAADFFGWSVAVSGSTAVVGAYAKDSSSGLGSQGAAYVFARSGGAWAQQAELTASDGVPGDDFGYSVAIWGSTVVVGAIGKNSGAGAAYVFAPYPDGTWAQQAELTAADGVPGDNFGASVAISGSTVVQGGSTVVVGAPGKQPETIGGAAYVFAGPFWHQLAELTPPGVVYNDGFGSSVAVSGSTVVVGAPGDASATGAVYVYAPSGSTWAQQAKLIAADGAPGDFFGWSVAILGSTVVIGARYKNWSAGAAYVFTRSGSSWAQQAELTAADHAAGEEFGSSVAISPSTVVVGAHLKNSATGAAYVFTWSGSSWAQQAELTAADGTADNFFGSSVAAWGSTAMVGAWGKSSDTGAAYVFALPSQQAKLTAAGIDFGYSVAVSGFTAAPGSTVVGGAPFENSNAGAAYVLTRSGGSWAQQAELTAADAAPGDFFGWTVAAWGATAVVGAPYKNSRTGAAYVFTRSGGAWAQQAELTAADGVAFNDFGYSVAISGSTVVVGAPFKNSSAGAAYVFTRSGGAWVQQAELTAADAAPGDFFGCSVAIPGSIAAPGSTVVVGAPYKNSSTGAAYVFTRSGSTWAQQAELTAADAAPGGDFGWTVAISGSTVVVAAPYKNSCTGAAYVFTGPAGTWTQQAELTAADGADDDYFGWSVAIYGSTIVVGARQKDSYIGAAYVFTPAGSTWLQQAELTAVDGAVGDHFGNSVAISGPTTVIGAPDNSSGAGAAYVFENV